MLANDRVVAEEPLLTDLGARIRDVRVGPDGAVYVLTDSGNASMSPNTPPTSRLLKPSLTCPSSLHNVPQL